MMECWRMTEYAVSSGSFTPDAFQCVAVPFGAARRRTAPSGAGRNMPQYAAQCRNVRYHTLRYVYKTQDNAWHRTDSNTSGVNEPLETFIMGMTCWTGSVSAAAALRPFIDRVHVSTSHNPTQADSSGYARPNRTPSTMYQS